MYLQEATEKGGEGKLGKAILDLADYAKATQAAESKELPLGRKGAVLTVSSADRSFLLLRSSRFRRFSSPLSLLPYSFSRAASPVLRLAVALRFVIFGRRSGGSGPRRANLPLRD